MASASALGLDLSEIQLSRLARRGSGSACRSIPTGFVEWQAGSSDYDSYAYSIAGPEHWDLVDCIALVNTGHKVVGSSRGHTLAPTSPLQTARVADTPRRLDQCRKALLSRDFDQMAEIVELDSNLMHAVMLTSTPSLIYWSPATLEIMRFVQDIRRNGFPACYTIDAGPNVHVLSLADRSDELIRRLTAIPGVRQVIRAQPGGPTRLLSPDEHPSGPNQDIIRPR
jgi:diphosphomevalonate decarboxylase